MGAESWNVFNEQPAPDDVKRLVSAAFTINNDDREHIRATFGTPAGRKCLDALHRRFVDQPRFDPDNLHPVYAAFYAEGAARLVRYIEASLRPEEGD